MCNHPESTECYCCGYKPTNTNLIELLYLDKPICEVCMEMICDKANIEMLRPDIICQDRWDYDIVNVSNLRDKEHSYFLLFSIPVEFDSVFRGNFNELMENK